MIQYLQQRLDGLLDQAIGRLSSQPLIGALVSPFLQSVKANIDSKFGLLIQKLQAAGTDGEYEAEVDAAIGYLNHAAGVPTYLFFLQPIVSMLLAQLRDYLVAHKDEFLGKIIVSPNPAA